MDKTTIIWVWHLENLIKFFKFFWTIIVFCTTHYSVGRKRMFFCPAGRKTRFSGNKEIQRTVILKGSGGGMRDMVGTHFCFFRRFYWFYYVITEENPSPKPQNPYIKKFQYLIFSIKNTLWKNIKMWFRNKNMNEWKWDG